MRFDLTAPWWALALLGLGVGCLVLGIGVRAGAWRGWVRDTQRNPHLAFYQRNATFVFLPWGAALVLGFVGGALAYRAGGLWAEAGKGALLVAFALGVAGGLAFVYVPPFLKPRWLREPHPDGAGAAQRGKDAPSEPTPTWARALTWAAAGGIAVLWYAFDWPDMVLVVVGLTLAYQVADWSYRSGSRAGPPRD